MRTESLQISNEESIETILLNRFLASPRLHDLIDQRANEVVRNTETRPVQELTRNQLAELWQITTRTLDRMTDKEIEANGYVRRKRGVSVRFEKLT